MLIIKFNKLDLNKSYKNDTDCLYSETTVADLGYTKMVNTLQDVGENVYISKFEKINLEERRIREKYRKINKMLRANQ